MSEVPMSPVALSSETTEAKQLRWRSNLSNEGEEAEQQPADVEKQQERWKKVSEAEQVTEAFSRSNFMAHANSLQHRGGLDFFALARGGERSYSTSFLVNLDPDLLTLCAAEHQTAYDLYIAALVSHTNRIFRMVQAKSKRDINQFCFGSTYVQLNPNYRKFDRMEPMTWKKEGISAHWTGFRGYRKKCCKVCCTDMTCNGCGLCKGCTNSPIRGNYDGLVVLTAVTRESLPNYHTVMTGATAQMRKNQEKYLDHENFAITLESALTSHFMYSGDPEMQLKCVPTARMAVATGEAIDDGRTRQQKKFSSYVIYVAYRLDQGHSVTHNAKISRQLLASGTHPHAPAGLSSLPENDNETPFETRNSSAAFKKDSIAPQLAGFGGNIGSGAYDIEDIDEFEYGKGADEGFGFGMDEEHIEEDEKLLEELEDKQLRERIGALESENSSIKEQVWKLEHGRTWVENRLTALETEIQDMKGQLKSGS